MIYVDIVDILKLIKIDFLESFLVEDDLFNIFERVGVVLIERK